MVACDRCKVWYHEICIQRKLLYRKHPKMRFDTLEHEFAKASELIPFDAEDQYICLKCERWSHFIKGPLGSIILQKKKAEI